MNISRLHVEHGHCAAESVGQQVQACRATGTGMVQDTMLQSIVITTHMITAYMNDNVRPHWARLASRSQHAEQQDKIWAHRGTQNISQNHIQVMRHEEDG